MRNIALFLADIIRNNDSIKFQMIADNFKENGGLLSDLNPFALQDFKEYEREYGINTILHALQIYNGGEDENI